MHFIKVRQAGRDLAEIETIGMAAQLPETVINTAKGVALGQIIATHEIQR